MIKLDRLDHLRWFACFAVLAWHYTHGYVSPSVVPQWRLLSILEEGHTGVSLFCVISGFLFAWLYGEREIKLGDFMKRRFLRLFPLFILIGSLSFFIDPAWTASDFLATLLTVAKPGTGLPAYLGPGWSLLIEIQFYLLFPFLALFVRKYGVAYLAGFIVLFLGIRLLVWLDKGSVQTLAYWTMFGRGDQFLMGMIAGFLCKRLRSVKDTRLIDAAAAAALVIGTAVIVGFYARFNEQGGYYGTADDMQWALIPLIEGGCYALIVAGYLYFPLPAWGTLWLQITTALNAVFSYLGRISYSIYMTQVLVLNVVKKTLAPDPIATWEAALVPFFLYAVPSIIICSSLTYFLIEKPFRSLNERKRPNAIPRLVNAPDLAIVSDRTAERVTS